MPEPVRLLHFADLHIGMKNYGRLDPETGTSSRVRDFLDRLDEVIDYALEHEADLTIFAGDAFKRRNPDPTQQREFARRIKRLADEMPVLLLVGNHDLSGMVSKASSVDIFRALNVSNVIVGRISEGRVIETHRGPLFLAWVPYPMRNRLLSQEQHRGKSVEELDLALRETVTGIVEDLSGQAAAHDMPRVLCGHFSVAEAMFGSERTVMLGRDVSVHNSTLANPTWDYVALGHIHKHQDVNGGRYPGVVYSGSLERIDFGEEKEAKGFCWVELSRAAEDGTGEHTQWQFIEVDARRFLTIRVDAREREDPTQAVMEAMESTSRQLAGAVVRMIVQIKSDQAPQLREKDIGSALRDAYSFGISREIEYEARTRIGGLAPETMTPAQLVERYFVEKGYEQKRVGRLAERLDSIFSNQ